MRIRRALPLAFLFIFTFLLPMTVATDSLSASSRLIVVIDAGHGGKDPGATGYQGITEKEINLEIARIIRFLSLTDKDVEVVLTRYDDKFIDLRERINMAERLGAAAYVSIHSNSFENPDVSGIETVLHDAPSSKNYGASLQLAKTLQKNMMTGLKAAGVRDRGVKERPLYTRWGSMPAVIVETGFVTSPQDVERLTALWYQLRLAQSILDGIKDYLLSR